MCETPIYHLKWVKVQSSKYSVFVLLEYDLINPAFGEVVDIMAVNGTTILSLKKHISFFFEVHFNSFVVKG